MSVEDLVKCFSRSECITANRYQPLMLNHWALEKMRVAAASYGVRDTCREFDVTHDVGFGVFVWLFELLHVRLPKTEVMTVDDYICRYL